MLEPSHEPQETALLRPNHSTNNVTFKLHAIHNNAVSIPQLCRHRSVDELRYDTIVFIMDAQKSVPFIVDRNNAITNGDEMLKWLKAQPKRLCIVPKSPEDPLRYIVVQNDKHTTSKSQGIVYEHSEIRILYYIEFPMNKNIHSLLVTKILGLPYGWVIDSDDVARAYLLGCCPVRISK